MTDLTDYAKREAMIAFPSRYLSADSTAQQRFGDGILDLAAELQREDVREVGAFAMADAESDDPEQTWDDLLKVGLAAMLQHLVEWTDR